MTLLSVINLCSHSLSHFTTPHDHAIPGVSEIWLLYLRIQSRKIPLVFNTAMCLLQFGDHQHDSWSCFESILCTTHKICIWNPHYWLWWGLLEIHSLSRQLHKCSIIILFTGTVQPLKEVPLYILTKLHKVVKLLDGCLEDKISDVVKSFTGPSLNVWMFTFSLFSGRGVVRMEKTCPKTRASSSVGRLPKK